MKNYLKFSLTSTLSFFFVVAITILFSLNVYAQFEVVMIKGEVYRNNEKVKLGDKVGRNEGFVFKSSDAAVGIYNSQVGRIVLPEREENQAIASSQGPQFVRDKYSTAIDELKKDFNNNLFISNSPSVDLKETFDAFNVLEKTKLVAKFENNGTVTYNTILVSKDSPDLVVNLNKNNLYKDQNGNPIDIKNITGHTELFILANQSDTDSKIDTIYVKTFNPVYIDDQENLKREIRIILNANQANNENNTKSFEMIKSYITKYYGKIGNAELEKWLKENFNVTK